MKYSYVQTPEIHDIHWYMKMMLVPSICITAIISQIIPTASGDWPAWAESLTTRMILSILVWVLWKTLQKERSQRDHLLKTAVEAITVSNRTGEELKRAVEINTTAARLSQETVRASTAAKTELVKVIGELRMEVGKMAAVIAVGQANGNGD